MKNLVLIAVETSTENYILQTLAAIILIGITVLITMVLKKKTRTKKSLEQKFIIKIELNSKDLATILQNVIKKAAEHGHPCHMKMDGKSLLIERGDNESSTKKICDQLIEQNENCYISITLKPNDDPFNFTVKAIAIREIIDFSQNKQEPQQEQRTYKKLVPKKCTCCGAQLKSDSNVCEYCKMNYIEIC